MQHLQQVVSAAAALLVWAGPVGAALPEPEDERAGAAGEAADAPAPATWLLIDARNHADETRGLVALLFGAAQERGRSRPANLRVDCVEGLTTLHVETAGLHAGPFAVTVTYSLDSGPFVAGAWQASADGSGLELSADRAIRFLTGLYGKRELRLAVVRPLSVPFLLTFAVAGAEQSLHTMADRCQWSTGPATSDAGR
jgi:hypothetical protein